MIHVKCRHTELRLLLLNALTFTLIGLAGHVFRDPATGLYVLWPANAVAVGALLARRAGRGDGAIVAGAGLGSFALIPLSGMPLPLLAVEPFAVMAEIALAAMIVRRLAGPLDPLATMPGVMALIAAALLAPIVSAVVGGTATALLFGYPPLASFAHWYGGAVLGLALMTPATLLALRLRERYVALRPTRPAIAEAVILFSAIALVAAVSFGVTSFRQMFAMPLIFPLVTLAAFRMRQFGAVAGMLIVALIGTVKTIGGVGPFTLGPWDMAHSLLALQLFVAVTFMTALPVAVAVSERDAEADVTRQRGERFRTVLENVDKVMFHLDSHGLWTYLNPAWEAVTGFGVAESRGRAWTEHLAGERHADFAEWLAPVIEGEVQSSRRLVRFATAHAGTRWMEMSFQTLRDDRGAPAGVTGTMRDVDDRKKLEEHVLLAKRRAEEQARDASLMATTDELTGIANRRAFLRRLERAVEATVRDGEPLSLAVFDVDHFKRVNDLHGHPVGDRVLRQVAVRALTVVRGGDVVGRIGGEEFGILMPGAPIDVGERVAERLRLAMQYLSEGGVEPLPSVTVSVGVAAMQPGMSADNLCEAADAALYDAKRGGRNRVRIAA